MKILVTTNKYPRDQNDTSVIFLRTLYEELATNQGLNIRIVAADDKLIDDSYLANKQNLSVIRCTYWFKDKQNLIYNDAILSNIHKSPLVKLLIFPFFVSFIFALYRECNRYKPQLIHAHWTVASGLVSVIVGKYFKIPVLLTLHGGDIYGIKSRLGIFINRFVLNNVNVIIPVSQPLKRELLSRYKVKADQVIPMGIDQSNFQYDPKAKDTLGIKDKKLILFVGRLSEKKGLLVLLEALRINLAIEDVLCYIIGSGNLKKTLIDYIASNELSDQVKLLGNVPNQELSTYYSASDVVVLPSISSIGGEEGFPVTFMEALSCRCNIVATRNGGMMDLKESDSLTLVDQNSPEQLWAGISHFLENEICFVDNELSTHFLVENVGQKFIDSYKMVLNG